MMTRWLSLLALLILTLVASAETFRLRNGTIINGTIKQGGGGSVRIETSEGVSTYRLIDFDDATYSRLKRYEAPAAAPATAPPPVMPTVVRQATPKPAATPNVEPETDEIEPARPTMLPKSRDEMERKLRELKGPSKLVYFAGLGLALIGGIWMIVRGFQESVLWGIAMILCGIVSLFFLFAHWSRAKDPFFLQLVGIALMAFALVVMG